MSDYEGELHRATALLELDRPEEARAIASRLVATDPSQAPAFRVLAHSLAELGDVPGALAAAGQAIALDPQDEQSHRIRSLVLTRAGQYDDAIAAAQAAVRLAPYEWRTHLALAHARLKTDPSGALQDARKAVEIAPSVPETHSTLGLVLAKLDRKKEAAAEYREALRLHPDHAIARNNLAVLELSKGNWTEAFDGFRSAIASDPKLDLARQNIDITAVAMLSMLRYIMAMVNLVMIRFAAIFQQQKDVHPFSYFYLGGWAVLVVAGVARIPRHSRRFVASLPRRNRRAAVLVATILFSILGLILGPTTRLLPVIPTYVITVVPLLVTAFIDGFRARRKKKQQATK